MRDYWNDPPEYPEFCEVCLQGIDYCICPKCPVCGDTGNPRCYQNQGAQHDYRWLHLNKAQLIARTKGQIADLYNRITDHHQYIIWLESQPDDYVDYDYRVDT